MSVDLPLPVVPTMPTMSPGSIVTLTSESTFLVRSNEKLTLRNSMRPRMTSGFSPSSADCSGSASRMSRMRSAAASALW